MIKQTFSDSVFSILFCSGQLFAAIYAAPAANQFGFLPPCPVNFPAPIGILPPFAGGLIHPPFVIPPAPFPIFPPPLLYEDVIEDDVYY